MKEALERPLTWIKYEFDFENITNDVGPFALDLSFMNKGINSIILVTMPIIHHRSLYIGAITHILVGYAFINGNNLGRYFSVVAGHLNCTGKSSNIKVISRIDDRYDHT